MRTPAHAQVRSRLSPRLRTSLTLLWIMVAAALPIWAHYDKPAWDTDIYLQAVHSLQAGHDPYAAAIAVQQAVHDQNPNLPSLSGPYSYVYSPITLPLLRCFALLTPWLAGLLYGAAYLAGIMSEVWAGFQAVLPRERRIFLFFVPLAIFFPGFLGSDSVLSGNVAFIFYGAILATCYAGWRHNRWRWFYLVVILASCFKAPLLSLLAIPLLSARRQWMPVAASAALGLTLFAIQPFLWPSLFRNYLHAVGLQFTYNRDFGFSPAGLFSGVLYDHHLHYSPACSIFYLLYAVPLFAFLFYLSRRFLRGDFSLQQWFPVLVVGVILLNPRLMEYDAAPLALPMALIAWRLFSSVAAPRPAAILFGSIFLAVNLIATHTWNLWKLTEGPLLVTLLQPPAPGPSSTRPLCLNAPSRPRLKLKSSPREPHRAVCLNASTSPAPSTAQTPHPPRSTSSPDPTGTTTASPTPNRTEFAASFPFSPTTHPTPSISISNANPGGTSNLSTTKYFASISRVYPARRASPAISSASTLPASVLAFTTLRPASRCSSRSRP